MIKVGVISVGKSKNIGDQLIAKSLGEKIEQNATIVSYFDFDSGEYEVDFKHEVIDINNYRENLHSKKKRYIRRTFKSIVKGFFYDKSKLDEFIAAQDMIVIGGGHLLIDNYLHFALKIDLIHKICRKKSVPYSIFSVGVSESLSYVWKHVMKGAIDKAENLFVRDSYSYNNLTEKGLRCDGVVLDPAFFSNELGIFSSSKGRILTLFIMDPNEMVRHSGIYLSRDDCANWWLSLYKGSIGEYDKIIFSNNGSDADFHFIKKYVEPRIKQLDEYVPETTTFITQVLDYSELLCVISKSSHVVAQRLHAVIPALSLGKQCCALKWDKKLEGILSDVGVENCLIDYSYSESMVLDKLNNSRVDLNFNSKKSDFEFCLKSLISEK